MGAAAVDFQVGTGRMPAQQPGAQIPKKKVIYSQAEIDQLAAYVASLGAGPTVPTKNQVSPEGADIANGGELFRTNCAQCHNFTGEGGALTHGKFAPSLEGVSPKHIYEAMQTGPQNMPSFPDTTMPGKSKRTSSRTSTRSTVTRPRPPAVLAWAGSARSVKACSPGSSASAH